MNEQIVDVLADEEYTRRSNWDEQGGEAQCQWSKFRSLKLKWEKKIHSGFKWSLWVKYSHAKIILSQKYTSAFPRVTPHGCVNTSQSFLPDVWTIICVNNPDFNDIGREVFFNGAWEAWLTNHIVKAMLNYPGAVLLGETRVKTIHDK